MNWKPLKSLQWTIFLDLYQQSELAVVKSHLESTSNYFRPFVERKTAAFVCCIEMMAKVPKYVVQLLRCSPDIVLVIKYRNVFRKETQTFEIGLLLQLALKCRRDGFLCDPVLTFSSILDNFSRMTE